LGMFRTLRIDSILGMFQKFADLFSETTVTGSALKTIVEGLFKPLEAIAGGPIFKIIKAAFEGLIIAALYATLGVLKLKNWLDKTFGGTSIGQINELDVALGVAAMALGVASVAAIALGVALAGIVGTAAMVAAPFVLLYEAIDQLRSIDLRATGENLIRGLVEGIKSGASWVVSEVQSLGGKIKGTIEGVLGIHSRSRFGIYAGKMLGEGLSFGVKSERPNVEMASGGLARAAAGGVATASAEPARSGTVMQIQSLIGQLVYQGNPDDSHDFERKVEDALSTALERLAIEQGVTFQLGGG
jgi:hypothetical protein